MRDFIIHANIARFRRLIAEEPEGAKRVRMIRMLREEEQKVRPQPPSPPIPGPHGSTNAHQA